MAQSTVLSTCPHCGVEFEHPSWAKREYCSKSCTAKARATPERMTEMQALQAASRANTVTVVCANCGMSFAMPGHKTRKYCSGSCRSKATSTHERMSAMRARRANNFPGIPGLKLCGICASEFQPVSARQVWCLTCIPDAQARARWQRYKITGPQWREMAARFDGKCWICRRREAVCVDHDHATGAVRGALCQKCNQALGFIEAPEWFAAARAYLGWR